MERTQLWNFFDEKYAFVGKVNPAEAAICVEYTVRHCPIDVSCFPTRSICTACSANNSLTNRSICTVCSANHPWAYRSTGNSYNSITSVSNISKYPIATTESNWACYKRSAIAKFDSTLSFWFSPFISIYRNEKFTILRFQMISKVYLVFSF